MDQRQGSFFKGMKLVILKPKWSERSSVGEAFSRGQRGTTLHLKRLTKLISTKTSEMTLHQMRWSVYPTRWMLFLFTAEWQGEGRRDVPKFKTIFN